MTPHQTAATENAFFRTAAECEFIDEYVNDRREACEKVRHVLTGALLALACLPDQEIEAVVNAMGTLNDALIDATPDAATIERWTDEAVDAL